MPHSRSFTTPRPGEDWATLACRVRGDLSCAELDAAIQELRSWNLHLLARRPPGEFLGSDVLFTEPPLCAGG